MSDLGKPRTDLRIKKIKQISIAIDTWDDVFSDFDPRPIKDRMLSEDFIVELKKRYRETKKGDFVIEILAPVDLCNPNTERSVIQRLKRDFKHRSLQKRKELSKLRRRGTVFVLFGIFFLTALTLLTYYKVVSKLAIEILGIIFMPLGWFGIWEGFSKIVDPSRVSIQEEIIFDKLSRAVIKFHYIEEDLATD
ncbi:MAG: hypothetical protein KAI43_03290 [Candidatus Aureabacteria bacterium]|nr:hypothetical protein [Candidatus Auribacterota bacterium]